VNQNGSGGPAAGRQHIHVVAGAGSVLMLGPSSVVGTGAELVVEEKEAVVVLVVLVCKLGAGTGGGSGHRGAAPVRVLEYSQAHACMSLRCF
jgi:hypothetical protein